MCAKALFSQFEVVQCGWHVTAQATDPAEIFVHEPQRQVQIEPGAQLSRFLQIGFRSSEFLLVAIEHGPVVQYPLHPHVVFGAAQYQKRSLKVRQRFIESAEQQQDRTSLGLSPGRSHTTQGRQRRLDVPQRLGSTPARVQREREPHLGFGR